MRFARVLTDNDCSRFYLLVFMFHRLLTVIIEREFTIREVLDACTNIVFGEVHSLSMLAGYRRSLL